MKEQSKDRIIWLDYARTIAIICVVLTHITEAVYTLDVESLMQYSLYRRIFVLSMFTIGRLGVPIFFFLTGYLLLDRKYSNEEYKRFLKNNFFGLLLTTLIWIFVYNIFNALFWKIPFSVIQFLKNIMFLKKTNMSHMWYMPVILGIYLFIPFVANALQNIEIKVIYIPLLIVFVYQFMVPLLNVYLATTGREAVFSLPDLSFSGNAYGFIVLLGYLIKKKTFDKIHSLAFIMLGILSFMFTVFIQNYSYTKGITYNVWYNMASLVIVGLAIFILLSRINFKDEKIVRSISMASFGIYLIHNMIVIALNRYYQAGISSIPRFVVMFVITFIISWILTILIAKIEPLAYILLFQRSPKKKMR